MFGQYAVSVQAENPDSTLTLYRRAMGWRTALNTGADSEWIEAGAADALHFRRSGGWHCGADFGPDPVVLPEGEVLLSSAPLEAGRLPQDATAWLLRRVGQDRPGG